MTENPLLVGLELMLLAFLLKAFALPTVKGLVRVWVFLLTIGLTSEQREARRGAIASDLWEQCAAENGAWPEITALHILWRWILGLPCDLVWRLRVTTGSIAFALIYTSVSLLWVGYVEMAHLLGLSTLFLLTIGFIYAVFYVTRLIWAARRRDQAVIRSSSGLLCGTCTAVVYFICYLVAPQPAAICLAIAWVFAFQFMITVFRADVLRESFTTPDVNSN